jgi:hypothetical protein
LATIQIKERKFWQGCGEIGTLVHYWWECKMVQPLWKVVQQLSKKLKIKQSNYPAISLLGIKPKRNRSGTHLCSLEHDSQQKCPPVDGRVSEMWHKHTMKYDSAFKR